MLAAQVVTTSTSDTHTILIEATAGIIVVLVTILPRTIKRAFQAGVKEILDEVRPNGGNTKKLGDTMLSTKESVERIETGVAGIYPRLDDVEAEVDLVKVEQTRVKAELAAIKRKVPLK